MKIKAEVCSIAPTPRYCGSEILAPAVLTKWVKNMEGVPLIVYTFNDDDPQTIGLVTNAVIKQGKITATIQVKEQYKEMIHESLFITVGYRIKSARITDENDTTTVIDADLVHLMVSLTSQDDTLSTLEILK